MKGREGREGQSHKRGGEGKRKWKGRQGLKLGRNGCTWILCRGLLSS